MVTIQLNGEPYRLDTPSTINGLVGVLQLECDKIAVEKNRTIVPRSQFADEPVEDGDAIEIIEFVGGG